MALLSVFIVSLGFLVTVLFTKQAELSRDGNGILGRLSSKYDSVIVALFDKFMSLVQETVSTVFGFMRKHVFSHSGDLYGRFKTFKDSRLEHFYETIRGKHDLSKHSSSSLFLWHLDPKNNPKDSRKPKQR